MRNGQGFSVSVWMWVGLHSLPAPAPAVLWCEVRYPVSQVWLTVTIVPDKSSQFGISPGQLEVIDTNWGRNSTN